MRIMIIVGARPNFMKAAPLIAAIREHNQRSAEPSSFRQPATAGTIHHILVHTGQHYDEAMSGSFFADLGLPKPDVHLEVGSGSHAAQTAEIMKRFEEVVLRERPDAVVVVGDVNSTLACALVASKLSYDSDGSRPLITHVEAGLRSFDHTMPEEINRILTDHIADLLFVTEDSAVRNLRHEGIPDEKIRFVGNTMIDSLLAFEKKADESLILNTLGLRGRSVQSEATDSAERYALLTLHRPSNVDNREAFLNILEGLHELAASLPVIFPVHPRTRKRIAEFNLSDFFRSGNGSIGRDEQTPISTSGRIHLIDPLSYLDFLCLMKHAALVVTDSGGIQEETTCMGIPCVTLRKNTERPVTIQHGTNVLAGLTKEGIRGAIHKQLAKKAERRFPDKWDGQTGPRIIEEMLAEFRSIGPSSADARAFPETERLRRHSRASGIADLLHAAGRSKPLR